MLQVGGKHALRRKRLAERIDASACDLASCRQMIFLMQELGKLHKEADDLRAASEEAAREHRQHSELNAKRIRDLETHVEEERSECEAGLQEPHRCLVSSHEVRASALIVLVIISQQAALKFARREDVLKQQIHLASLEAERLEKELDEQTK